MEFSTYYHIYNHANGNENLFLNDENFSFFLKKYAIYIYPICKTYAYCLMPNHFHLLVKTRDETEIRKLLDIYKDKEITENIISKHFANFFSSYTQSFNKVYQRRGSLFIKNFKRKKIESDAYFTNLIHYIHHNPIHHGFASSIEDWQWSSYHSIISEKKSLMERDEVLQWFSDSKHYIEFHQKPIDKKFELDMEF